MCQPKNASLYPVCIVFSEYGRSFKSLADTSSGIQVTNIFILIHGFCLQAMYGKWGFCVFLEEMYELCSTEIWNHKISTGL